MSKSPSPSPTTTTNLSTKPSVAPPQPEHAASTSRHQTHDNSPPSQTGERVIPSSHFHSFVHSSSSPHPEPIAGPSRPAPSRIRPREEDSPEEPMAKRLRRDSVQAPTSDRSRSPSTEGGLADTEEAERSQQSEISSAPVQAPKKKRTRTLTTPHQSAVLHALLAQSRFPTTAMREEVGRAIGLSARKVQIWFQNQRQKARRPRAQNEVPIHRPPQYGPFPSVPEPELPALYARPPPSDPRLIPEPLFEDRYARYPPAPPTTILGGSPPGSSPRLLGPGVPGFISSSRSVPAASSIPERTSPEISSLTSSRPYSSRLPTYPRSPSPLQVPRPSTTHVSETRLPYRDPSRTLPPLIFPPPGQRSPSVRSAPANIAPPYPYREPSYESVVLPRVASNPPVGNFPPPFALQPQPQWDSSSFNPHAHSWSHSGSERSQSISPTTTRGLPPIRDLDEESTTDLIGSSRRARFDPVRSALTPPSPSKTPPRSSRSTDTTRGI